MNYDKLREAEANFLQVYPAGFADPAMQAIRKKHNVDKLVEFTQANSYEGELQSTGVRR